VLDGQSRPPTPRQIPIARFLSLIARISAFCAKPSGARDEIHRAALREAAMDQRPGRTGYLQNLPGRLASALIRLADKHKLAPGDRTIAVTQQEISEMVGMTRESINKQLRFGPPQMGSSRAWRHRRVGCRAASGAGRSGIGRRRRLEHDPEKRVPILGKNHARTRGQATDLIQRSLIRSQLAVACRKSVTRP